MDIIKKIEEVAPVSAEVFHNWCIENKRVMVITATTFDYRIGVILRYLDLNGIFVSTLPIAGEIDDEISAVRFAPRISFYGRKNTDQLPDCTTREGALCDAVIYAFKELEKRVPVTKPKNKPLKINPMSEKENQEFSLDKSKEEALKIGLVQEYISALDTSYLADALKNMRENHSMRESMAVMNPSPFTHNEQQDLNSAKLEQLSLMLKLAENTKTIKELSIKLGEAKQNANKFGELFGGVI